jgi:2-keto-3-deoxy-L-rhamnonate aldolase RhmA
VGALEQAARYRELGFSFLGVGSDGVLLTNGSQDLARGLHALAGADA